MSSSSAFSELRLYSPSIVGKTLLISLTSESIGFAMRMIGIQICIDLRGIVVQTLAPMSLQELVWTLHDC